MFNFGNTLCVMKAHKQVQVIYRVVATLEYLYDVRQGQNHLCYSVRRKKGKPLILFDDVLYSIAASTFAHGFQTYYYLIAPDIWTFIVIFSRLVIEKP